MLFILPKKNDKSKVTWSSEDWPEIAILTAAYNEEKVIGDKIRSVIEGNYPLHKITFYLGSDASTDRTDEIIEQYAFDHPWIKLVRFGGRTGKSGIINSLADKSEAGILILTDANVIFEKDTLMHLVKHFYEEDTAQVCANIIKISSTNNGSAGQEKTYIALENKIKYSESLKWGFVMGAEGACYAIRRSNYRPVPAKFFMDDFFITLNVVEQGGKIKFEPDAVCYEDVPVHSDEEFKRKVRISVGNFQNLIRYKNLLFKFNSVSFAFFSHKVLRWITPFSLMALVIISFLLSFHAPFFIFLTIFQMCGLLLPFLDEIFHFRWKIIKYLSHFYLMNYALLKGFFIYAGGVKSNVWQPTKRNV